MDKLEFFGGGLPMSVDRLQAMQDCWLGIHQSLAAAVAGDTKGNYILSGCGTAWDADGWLMVGGEAMPFVSGHKGGFIAISGETQTLTYQDGEQHPYHTHRFAHLDTLGVPTSSFTRISLATMATQAALAAAQTKISQLENILASINSALGSVGIDMTKMGNSMVPCGTIIMWHGAYPLAPAKLSEIEAAMPWGYLPCSSACPGGVWNEWLSLIGYSESSVQFNGKVPFTALPVRGKMIPDLAGRFPLGATGTYGLGASGGEETHALTRDEMPAHTHTFKDYYMAERGTTLADKKATNRDSISTNGKVGSGETDSDNDALAWYKHSTETAGVGAGHNNMPPWRALNFLIKAV